MCEKNVFKRLNYFQGMMLSAEDFNTEQNYIAEKQRHHNRYLHGWGVVSGFAVATHDTGVVVEPGIAIDCAGNDIVLTSAVECHLPRTGRDFFVVVEYCETEVDFIPTPDGNDIPSEQAKRGSRIQEGCHVEIIHEDPAGNHDGIGPGTPGCGRQHALTIARLFKERDGWRVAVVAEECRRS